MAMRKDGLLTPGTFASRNNVHLVYEGRGGIAISSASLGRAINVLV